MTTTEQINEILDRNGDLIRNFATNPLAYVGKRDGVFRPYPFENGQSWTDQECSCSDETEPCRTLFGGLKHDVKSVEIIEKSIDPHIGTHITELIYRKWNLYGTDIYMMENLHTGTCNWVRPRRE